MHDAWAPYWHYGCRHGPCNAHHLRELTAVAEQPGQAWATELRATLLAMKAHVAGAGAAAGGSDAFVARYRPCSPTATPPTRPPPACPRAAARAAPAEHGAQPADRLDRARGGGPGLPA
ncbi:MAG: transposase [Chloroflexia bacterium]